MANGFEEAGGRCLLRREVFAPLSLFQLQPALAFLSQSMGIGVCVCAWLGNAITHVLLSSPPSPSSSSARLCVCVRLLAIGTGYIRTTTPLSISLGCNQLLASASLSLSSLGAFSSAPSLSLSHSLLATQPRRKLPLSLRTCMSSILSLPLSTGEEMVLLMALLLLLIL